MYEADQRSELRYTLLIRKVSARGVPNLRLYVIYGGRLYWQNGYKSSFHRQMSLLRSGCPNQIVSRIFLSCLLMGGNGLLNFNVRLLILMNVLSGMQLMLKQAFEIPGLPAAIGVKNKKLLSKQSLPLRVK